MPDFRGKIGFVTGGGTGIGLACARAIAAGGGRVVIGGRREQVLRKAAAELGPNADWVACDVTSDDSVEGAVATVVKRHGGLQLAVNSAGIGGGGSVLNSTSEDFAKVLDTNLVGVFRSMRAEARAMKQGGGGSIVNVSSIAGALTHRWMDSYCASKAGLNMLSMCAADDLGEHGIRVNAIMPGLTRTDLAEILVTAEVARAEYLRLMPISRIGEPDDVGALTAFLLSDEARWITGQVIGVDGGHTIRKGPDLVPLFRQFMPPER
jgi:NAD(P)-dependent dehydrogenase (short-subunit alcohol dehydrogenase family)